MFELMGEKIDARPELRIKRTRTHCMVACRNQGPILVVYPEGVWYRCDDETALERIVVEHLVGGREVGELIFHRLGEGDIAQWKTKMREMNAAGARIALLTHAPNDLTVLHTALAQLPQEFPPVTAVNLQAIESEVGGAAGT